MQAPIPDARRFPPSLSSQEMRRLDYWAEREFQLPLIVMTENAGRAMADFLLRRYHPSRQDPILVLAGKGGNGAGVLAAARHLRHRGFTVTALTTEVSTKLKDEAKKHLTMFRREGGSAPPNRAGDEWPPASYILDGILGYGLAENPKGPAADLVRRANATKIPILSLDLPSGLHPDTGKPSKDTVRAQATLAIALPKTGLLQPSARPYLGELYLADVAFPRALYDEFETTPEAVFGDDDLVRLPRGPDGRFAGHTEE